MCPPCGGKGRASLKWITSESLFFGGGTASKCDLQDVDGTSKEHSPTWSQEGTDLLWSRTAPIGPFFLNRSEENSKKKDRLCAGSFQKVHE